MKTEKESIENQEGKGIEVLIAFVVIVGTMLWGYGKVCFKGLQRLNYKSVWVYYVPLAWFVSSVALVKYNYAHYRFLYYLLSDHVPDTVFYWMTSFGKPINAMVLFVLGLSLVLFIMGLVEMLLCRRFENAIKTVGLKNALKESPEVKRVIHIDDERKLLKINSPGLSVTDWENKKESLAFAFRSYVDNISISKDLRFINILISSKDLPKVVKYQEIEELDTKPFTFVVGKSKTSLVTKSIRECPHFLMGGATGMGKSTAFKLMLYSLLKNTPPKQIHLCLLDLKRGVEVADFKDFPNVEIAKTESDAVNTLEAVVKEMSDRYDMIAAKEFKSIDPERDKVPIIVVAVDEASVIFGTSGRSSEKRKMANEARSLCEEIGKLGRAAGIHLVLATQRATKTSIDTVTMDNLDARLSFRTRSVSGSTAILGDKSGVKIPDIPGRAIWQKGTLTEKVQVPFIQESDLSKRCGELSGEIKGETDGKTNFRLMPSAAEEFQQPDKPDF